MYTQQAHPSALVGEFRRTAVLVPLDEAGGLWSVDMDGIRWVCAFTDETALARFAVAHGLTADGAWDYRSVLGARLLDVVVPAVTGPAGVALDVGGERPVLFPPVRGIVPDEVALDALDVPGNRFATATPNTIHGNGEPTQ
ncbi:SseB family protein [Streptomyces griseocarneus]|uniref:SseB family protein n=1 Tax=Streptomyces griseocarneus TaxID=51201 RepID=UPI0027E03A22|nr:SseB family protein [Streptomyces griseocarneus]